MVLSVGMDRIRIGQVLRTATFAGLVNGPLGHYWYVGLDAVRHTSEEQLTVTRADHV